MARPAGLPAARSLSRVAVRSDAAADHGGGGEALLREVRGDLARCGGAGCGAGGGRDGRLGGAGLLLTRPQSGRLCTGGGGARRLSRYRGGVAQAAGAGRLYRGCRGGHRVRAAGRGRRCQCGAGGIAPVRHCGAAAGRAQGDPHGNRYHHARPARRRFRAGDDGPRQFDLHRARAEMPAVSAIR